MALPITDILKPLTAEEILSLMLDLAEAIGLPTTAWQTGEAPLAILEIIAQALAKIWNDGALPILSAPFLDYVSGDILTIVAAAVYGTIRYDATFSNGPGTVENSSSDIFNFAIGDIRIRKNSKTYRNKTAGALAPWDGISPKPTVGLTFIAETIGASSTLVPDLIPIEVISGQIGISVTADSAWVGQDQERDDDLRTRARSAQAAASPNGPKLAYDYVLRSTKRPDGTSIDVTRVRVEPPPGDGTLTIYVASPTGEVDPADVALLQTAVTDNVEPQCATVTVLSADGVIIPVTANIYVRTSVTVQNIDVSPAAELALADWFRITPIGGWKLSDGQLDGFLYLSEVAAVLSAADASIFKVDVISPLADVLIAPNQVPVLGTVILNITQVSV